MTLPANGARSWTRTATGSDRLPGAAAPRRLLQGRARGASGRPGRVRLRRARRPCRCPGDWNTQRPELLYYEGPLWYRRRFDLAPAPGRRYLLHFEAANTRRARTVNGARSGIARGRLHALRVRRDRPRAGRHATASWCWSTTPGGARRVPTVMTDWWNYGGLTRPRASARPAGDVRPRLPRAARARLAPHGERLGPPRRPRAAQTGHDPTSPRPRVAHARARPTPTGAPSSGSTRTLALWSPETPRLYDVEIAAETDRVTERIGFRTIEVRGTDILLNGTPDLPARHLRARGGARARRPRLDARRTRARALGWVKELGCNFVRLAHYPHNETMTRDADRLGLLVWSEIPVYWTIDWSDPRPLASARAAARRDDRPRPQPRVGHPVVGRATRRRSASRATRSCARWSTTRGGSTRRAW